MEDIMKEFDKDGDSKVSKEEFVNRFTKWLDETKGAVDIRPYRSISSWKDLYQVFRHLNLLLDISKIALWA